jgi:hypothetical protein
MTEIEPFLVINRTQRHMITLPSKSDAAAFIDREEKLWSWIDDGAGHTHNQGNGVAGRYRPENWIPRFRQSLQQATQEDFKQIMQQRYNAEQNLCAIDPESPGLQALADADKVVAVVALATIHGEIPIQDVNFLRSDIRNRIGVAHGNSLLAGVDTSIVVGTNRALMESRGAIDLEAQRMRALIDKSQVDASKSVEQIEAAAHALGAAHEQAFSKAESERAEAYSKLRNELDATAKAFEIQMELQAPVAYWRARAGQYRRTSGWALSLLIIFAVASVGGLYHLYDVAASHLPSDAATVPYAALFRASTFALLMTSIVFWVGRVLLRIYLSARHLTTDAEERRTMITTFLSLTRKSIVKDDDRKFILAALFRPGTDGIVNEEAAPDTMFAALMGSILKK